MNRHAGFTLIELMVVMVVVFLLVGALLTTFVSGRTSFLSMDASVQTQEQARKAFDYVMRELRESGNINVTGANRRMDFQILRGYNQATAPCVANQKCWGNEAQPGQWVHYVITGAGDNAQLVRCLTPGRDDAMPAGYAGCRVLANQVNGAAGAFSYDGSKTVTLSLQTASINPALPTGRTTGPALTSSVQLRN